MQGEGDNMFCSGGAQGARANAHHHTSAPHTHTRNKHTHLHHTHAHPGIDWTDLLWDEAGVRVKPEGAHYTLATMRYVGNIVQPQASSPGGEEAPVVVDAV